MRFFGILIFSVLWVFRPVALAGVPADFIDTNLGAVGNARIAETFAKYIAHQIGCRNSGTGKRILMTGFGRWLGSDFNISGEVARAFLDDKFWPAEMNLDMPEQAGKTLLPAPETLYGASVGQRSLVVNGVPFEICSLYLDVTWDLAAAIIVREMEQFKPQMVFMSGRGFDNAVLEGAVSNLALGSSGYDGKGEGLGPTNIPWCGDRPCGFGETNSVLPEKQPGVFPVIRFSWDNARLAARSQRYFEKAYGRGAETPSFPSANNTYLCNNVGYVAAHAATGIPVALAGGGLTLSAHLAKPPTVGFFHYPGNVAETPTAVFRWAQAMASLWFELPNRTKKDEILFF